MARRNYMIPSWISGPFMCLLTLMIHLSNSNQCQGWIVLIMLIVPMGFFFLFGTMEDKILSRGIQFILPTPISLILLYPSRLPLIDLKHFKYIINNDICADKDVFGVILVHTHPANREVRDVMRKYIPQEDLNDIGMRRVFLMARAEWNDQELYPRTPQYAINEENVLHADIVQGNFKEHYHNLTYKHVMGLQWVGKYCPNAKYIIKMDDDIIVDVFQFRDLLKYRYDERDNLILGLLQVDAKPIRNKKSKWYVNKEEFRKDTYANFVSGWAYAMSTDAASAIVNRANRSPYFWIDDVHLTGTIAEAVGVKREGLNRFYTLHQDYLRCCINTPKYGNFYCDFYVGPAEGDNHFMEQLLQHARDCYIRSCSRRPLEDRLAKTCATKALDPLLPAGRGHGEVISL